MTDVVIMPPWAGEPNTASIGTDDGYRFLVARNETMGHLCGYLAIPKGHPWANQHAPQLAHVQVHNGISYSCPVELTSMASRCPAGWWVVGFACANHEHDWIPGLPRLNNAPYRSVAWVMDTLKCLADEAREAARLWRLQ